MKAYWFGTHSSYTLAIVSNNDVVAWHSSKSLNYLLSKAFTKYGIFYTDSKEANKSDFMGNIYQPADK